MKKPIIGVTPMVDGHPPRPVWPDAYVESVMQCGGIGVVLPMTGEEQDLRQLMESLDGLLVTGGWDVDPSVYGEERDLRCGPSHAVRDETEAKLVRIAWEIDKPILGICRGIQILNAALGGTLWQDLPGMRPSDVVHGQPTPHGYLSHSVDLLPGTPIHGEMGTDRIPVNSYHHQAVKDPAPGMRVMATAPDGVVEAIYAPNKRFVWGVQWHPELITRVTKESLQLFRAFVRAAEQ